MLSWTQDTIVAVPQELPAPKRKHTLLPLLIVLFLVSYGLLALLVVEQDRTIGSQRTLITSLFSDSTELTTLKGKFFQQQRPQTQAGAATRSQAQSPSTQAPMTQAPMTQAPTTQNAPGGNAQSSRNASKRKPLPPKPPLGIADIVDGRRIVKSI